MKGGHGDCHGRRESARGRRRGGVEEVGVEGSTGRWLGNSETWYVVWEKHIVRPGDVDRVGAGRGDGS